MLHARWVYISAISHSPPQGTASRPRSSYTIPPSPDGIDHPALMSDSKSATTVMQKNPNGTNDGSKGTPGSGTSTTTDGTTNGTGSDQTTTPYMMTPPTPGGLSPPPYHYKRRK